MTERTRTLIGFTGLAVAIIGIATLIVIIATHTPPVCS